MTRTVTTTVHNMDEASVIEAMVDETINILHVDVVFHEAETYETLLRSLHTIREKYPETRVEVEFKQRVDWQGDSPLDLANSWFGIIEDESELSIPEFTDGRFVHEIRFVSNSAAIINGETKVFWSDEDEDDTYAKFSEKAYYHWYTPRQFEREIEWYFVEREDKPKELDVIFEDIEGRRSLGTMNLGVPEYENVTFELDGHFLTCSEVGEGNFAARLMVIPGKR